MSDYGTGHGGVDNNLRSYDEILQNPVLKDSERERLTAEALVAYISMLLVRRGDVETARLMLLVERWALEWDNEGQEKDLVLDVDPANRGHFTQDVIEKLRAICSEVSDRFKYGINWIEVRETLPALGPGWRDQFERELKGERPTNQARRLQTGPPRWVEDDLLFTNAGEQRVYRALKHRQEQVLPAEDTIAIFPLPNGRVSKRTWEPDFLVTYKGRAGVLEVDGPHHNARRALDRTRDHLLHDSGIAYVDRVPVEALESPKELNAVVDRFLRRLAESR
ncbi:hypothetical protein [Streptomyces antimicrobicus]|uniref:DUF559 domain-containing protein n=1 Tax=Streptomyces antimicrobicus TaxID=2883108 RepID=A0ABS8B5Q5_9ACTN|nr:hypothetical protein [Streptomyces antimicrobicus]MCB5179939.1 hypothetical protein [Streptomyces antimicrobicus]